jgi:hypothetical protein
MTPCEKVLGLLNDYADGELSAEETRAAQEHLASCAGCRAALDEIHTLLAQAASLPSAIEPSRDLWEGIESRIRTGSPQTAPAPPSRRQIVPHWAAVAAVFLAVVAGGSWFLLRRPAESPTSSVRPAISPPSVQSAGLREIEAGYAPARGDLLRLIQERKGLLTPETRAVIDENLALVDQALRNIRGALEKDPSNKVLMDLLRNTYRQEQEMMRRAAALPADA